MWMIAMNKQTAHANRLAAELSSSLSYQGQPCKKCGSTERYTISAQCVACTRGNKQPRQLIRETNRMRLEMALAAGEKTFVPFVPCMHGHQLRYTATDRCVECNKASSRRFSLANPDYNRLAHKEWRENNRDYLRAKDRANKERRLELKIKAQQEESANREALYLKGVKLEERRERKREASCPTP